MLMGLQGGLFHGVAHGLNSLEGVAWARDVLNYPMNAAAFLEATGLSATYLWRFNQVSGNATDLIGGSLALVPTGTPTQNVADANIGTCVQGADGSAQRMEAGVNTTELYLTNAANIVYVAVCAFTATPGSANRVMFGGGNSASHVSVFRSGLASGTGTCNAQTLDGGNVTSYATANITQPIYDGRAVWCAWQWKQARTIEAFVHNGTDAYATGPLSVNDGNWEDWSSGNFRVAVLGRRSGGLGAPLRCSMLAVLTGANAASFTATHLTTLRSAML